MRPENLKTRIFLDSGDPIETREIIKILGFLDGQTTNPSLFAKSSEVVAQINEGKRFSKEDIYTEYKKIITEIRSYLLEGDISIEVYSDQNTTAEEMVKQAREMAKWISSYHIKLPSTSAGIKAAHILSQENIPINMTLCFSQDQAAAIYGATKGDTSEVFVSPFIGRLDDIDFEGEDLVRNISRMYANSDHHVKVLAASIRDLPHLLYTIYLGIDIVTVPFKILREWSDAGKPVPSKDDPKYLDEEKYFSSSHPHIQYEELDLNSDWESFDVHTELTDKGIIKFATEWNNLLES